ncbi:hypothetical protein R3P38DRAFT_3496352 [Favolaschia claudopus]|uniref:Myb/SANT-like domain-containing protein n=1 Tax=Favolaschia claudopus TaxID=2862362 RepID=A0AAW0C5R6_9AGAR
MPRATSSAASEPLVLKPGLPTTGDAVWLLQDQENLLSYLVDHVADAGDGGNFRAATFRGAAIYMESSRTKGGPKTAKSCESKYRELRKLWKLVQIIQGISGWTWSDKHGVTVTPATQGTWDAFAAKNEKAKRFKNKGWPFYDKMIPLMPEKATGSNVFRVGQTSTDANASGRSSSPDWDMSMFEGAGNGEPGGAGDDDGDSEGDGGDLGAGEDGDSDVNEDVNDRSSSTPAPSSSSLPAPTTGKRAPARPTATQPKRVRVGAGTQALMDLNTTATEFNDIFRCLLPSANQNAAPASAAIPPPPGPQLSPQRRTAAIELAKKEVWLDTSQRVALIQIVRDARNADVYLEVADDEALRVMWILEELKRVGVFAFHPEHSSFDMNDLSFESMEP